MQKIKNIDIEKILGLILILIYILWLAIGQQDSMKVNATKVNDAEVKSSIAESHSININRTQENMKKDIQHACESDGWDTTEFKSNTILAEKTIDSDTFSVTIKFDNSTFNISPENIDLENTINKALNI